MLTKVRAQGCGKTIGHASTLVAGTDRNNEHRMLVQHRTRADAVRSAIDLFTRLPDEGLGALDSGGVTPRD
ncbi:hypothetical protein GCM10009762_17360 [Dermacoccus barathri]|uniref:Uncharacterized protein n=1 Tax=Dermacoccus barathri TaxID=322601 RepID=A0ABN2BQ73_9MICO